IGLPRVTSPSARRCIATKMPHAVCGNGGCQLARRTDDPLKLSGAGATSRAGSARASAVPREHGASPASAAPALAPSDLLDMYRTMYLSRYVDEREIVLKRQNKIFFQINGVG